VVAAGPAPARPGDGEDWNDAKIRWLPFEQGLQTAAAEGKPVCLVFFTTWCSHCRNYRKVFDDARVVELAQRFAMIRVNKDQHAELSARFAPDGEYIPRTLFLSSDGTLDPGLQAPRPTYRYFYDERDPASVLAGMQAALQKLK
jgi:thiol:disulfide interchange protein